MKVTKAHCMFEQSGTFKNEFIKLGIPAEDYDILDDYGQTDHVIDLYHEIDEAYADRESIFDKIKEDELIFAFFPCTYFQSYHSSWFLAKAPNCRTMTDLQKLEMVHTRHQRLHQNYQLITELCIVVLRKNLRMIIENPYTQPHYLTRYFPIEPKFIDSNRAQRGDYYRKPTQFWFIGCDPENNFILEPMLIHKRKTIDSPDTSSNSDRARERSEISHEYANRFIREFILDEEEVE